MGLRLSDLGEANAINTACGANLAGCTTVAAEDTITNANEGPDSFTLFNRGRRQFLSQRRSYFSVARWPVWSAPLGGVAAAATRGFFVGTSAFLSLMSTPLGTIKGVDASAKASTASM